MHFILGKQFTIVSEHEKCKRIEEEILPSGGLASAKWLTSSLLDESDDDEDESDELDEMLSRIRDCLKIPRAGIWLIKSIGCFSPESYGGPLFWYDT